MKKKGIIIALVGPHYAGKSTLSTILQKKKKFIQQEEDWWKDPFRQTEPRDYFRSQVWYVLQRAEKMIEAQALKNKDIDVVLDSFIYSTLIFGRTKLNDVDFKVLEDLCNSISRLLPKPDYVIYLHARPEFLYNTRRMQRVKDGSGPKSDVNTSLEWIKDICELHSHYFDTWNQTPILKINVEKIDITSSSFLKDLSKKISF